MVCQDFSVFPRPESLIAGGKGSPVLPTRRCPKRDFSAARRLRFGGNAQLPAN
jgi:hypothetical protein